MAVEPRTIHDWAESGKIPTAVRVGRTIRFNLDHVNQALADETAERQRMKQEQSEARRSGKEASAFPGQAPETELPWA